MTTKGFTANISRDMKKGMVKVMILSYIKSHRTYPYAILKIAKTAKTVHGYHAFEDITKNDIYNLTYSLEKEGYIKSKARLSGNKVQKVFTITKKGEGVVKDKDRIFLSMIKALKRLVKEEFDV
jgi:DNA-binding PadR family transcriptional regulator